MPSAHFSTSSASHPLGTIRWRGGRQPSGFLNSPGPAPEAGDPSLGLPVCAIGLACIFIYFCCCSFFFFFFLKDKRLFNLIFFFFDDYYMFGLPRWLSCKESSSNAGDVGSIPGLGRCPGERNGNPLQYSCLENPMERGAWRATVHGVAKSQTRLSD